MHITDLTMEGFVLQAGWWLWRSRHLGFNAAPREWLDGSVAISGFHHCLVLGTWTQPKGLFKSESIAARFDQTPTVSHHFCGPGAGRLSWQPLCRASSREAATLSLLLSLRLERLPLRLCARDFLRCSGWGAAIGQRSLQRDSCSRVLTVKKDLDLRDPTRCQNKGGRDYAIEKKWQ